MLIPRHMSYELVHEVCMLVDLCDRGRYKAVKLVHREQGVSLKEAKQLVARVADFTWSDPSPRS